MSKQSVERCKTRMGKITVQTCEIEGLKVITPTVFGDARGYFMETYQYEDFKAAGIDQVFVQDNQSASKKGVLRGLHFQINHPQDKLVRVIKGEVYDVAVDLRKDSATFGKWYGVLLSEENKKNMTNYSTPYGDILIGIDASKIRMQEEEEKIHLDVEYALEINYEHLADCHISIGIQAKGESV